MVTNVGLRRSPNSLSLDTLGDEAKLVQDRLEHNAGRMRQLKRQVFPQDLLDNKSLRHICLDNVHKLPLFEPDKQWIYSLELSSSFLARCDLIACYRKAIARFGTRLGARTCALVRSHSEKLEKSLFLADFFDASRSEAGNADAVALGDTRVFSNPRQPTAEQVEPVANKLLSELERMATGAEVWGIGGSASHDTHWAIKKLSSQEFQVSHYDPFDSSYAEWTVSAIKLYSLDLWRNLLRSKFGLRIQAFQDFMDRHCETRSVSKLQDRVSVQKSNTCTYSAILGATALDFQRQFGEIRGRVLYKGLKAAITRVAIDRAVNADPQLKELAERKWHKRRFWLEHCHAKDELGEKLLAKSKSYDSETVEELKQSILRFCAEGTTISFGQLLGAQLRRILSHLVNAIGVRVFSYVPFISWYRFSRLVGLQRLQRRGYHPLAHPEMTERMAMMILLLPWEEGEKRVLHATLRRAPFRFTVLVRAVLQFLEG